MSDGTPNDPTKRPMPWDAQPGDEGATPSEPSSLDATPTEVTPTPEPPPPGPPAVEPPAAEPASQPGLISAAPVGWGAPEGSAAGAAPIAPPGPAEPGAPTVGWAAPPTAPQVPGAPGLAFADTVSRVVGYIVDLIILGIVGAVIAGVARRRDIHGHRRPRTARSPTTTGVSGAAFTVPVVDPEPRSTSSSSGPGGRRATHRPARLQHPGRQRVRRPRPLTVEQAVRRWLGLGLVPRAARLRPGLAALAR